MQRKRNTAEQLNAILRDAEILTGLFTAGIWVKRRFFID
jgi:hypothetical protein